MVARMRYVLFLMWLCSAVQAAQLQFTTDKLELKPTDNEKVISAKFSFQNTGTDTLTITQVDPSCGCTTTHLDRTSYKAGERGELAILFDTSGLGGLQEKTIQIYYDKGPMILLHLRVLLAEPPSVTPTFLYWQVGGEANEQVARFTFPAGVKEHPTEVIASSPAAKGTLYHHDDGTWVIAVTPSSTAEPANVMLKINTNLGRTMRVFASVRK